MLLVVETDAGRLLKTRLGESIQINVAENASTGYQWTIDHHDDELIVLVGTEPRYLSKRPGNGGQVSFAFKANKAGTGIVILKHWRPWEGDSSIIGHLRFCFRVRP